MASSRGPVTLRRHERGQHGAFGVGVVRPVGDVGLDVARAALVDALRPLAHAIEALGRSGIEPHAERGAHAGRVGVTSIVTVPRAPGAMRTCSRSPGTGPSGVVTAVSTSATTAGAVAHDRHGLRRARPAVAVRYPSGMAPLSPATSRPSASMNESDHGSVSICARRSPVPTVTVSALAAVGSTRSRTISSAAIPRVFVLETAGMSLFMGLLDLLKNATWHLWTSQRLRRWLRSRSSRRNRLRRPAKARRRRRRTERALRQAFRHARVVVTRRRDVVGRIRVEE